MIEIKKVRKKEELIEINILLEKNGLDKEIDIDDIIFYMKENENIIGVTKLSIIKNVGILKYLVIDKDKRGYNLGDALLRGILNYCDINNIKKVYYLFESQYLLKKGFRIANNIEINLLGLTDVNSNKVLICDTSDFFEKKSCTK